MGRTIIIRKLLTFKRTEVVPVCPEMLGGLSCPRIPCEKVGDKIMDKEGNDCTKQFIKGAEIALNIAKEKQVDFAILQRRSPSCGYSLIYDGTFNGNLIVGSGFFAQKLQSLDIPIMEAESEKFV